MPRWPGRRVKNGDVNPDGVREGYGRVWRYLPDADVLQLLFESPGPDVLDSPDDLTVTPRGGLRFCEDDGGTLLANIFGDASPGSGMTVAITGPWTAGPL